VEGERVNGVGGRSIAGWILALAMAGATPVYAQEAESPDASALPDIKWSLSGESSVRAPDQRPAETRTSVPPAAARKVTVKVTAVKKAAPAAPVLARSRTKPVAVRPIVRTMPAARPVAKPAVARVAPPAVKPLPAKPPVRPMAAATAATPTAARAPAPVQPRPVTPAPTLIDESDPGLVTTEPLTPRAVATDEDGGHAVAAVTSLRPTVGMLALAAALLGLAAIWWKSVGTRMWHTRRRKAQPRLMIDIPLADQPEIGELPMAKIAFDRESA
jgi:hypothetical protein